MLEFEYAIFSFCWRRWTRLSGRPVFLDSTKRVILWQYVNKQLFNTTNLQSATWKSSRATDQLYRREIVGVRDRGVFGMRSGSFKGVDVVGVDSCASEISGARATVSDVVGVRDRRSFGMDIAGFWGFDVVGIASEISGARAMGRNYFGTSGHFGIRIESFKGVDVVGVDSYASETSEARAIGSGVVGMRDRGNFGMRICSDGGVVVVGVDGRVAEMIGARAIGTDFGTGHYDHFGIGTGSLDGARIVGIGSHASE